MAYTLYGRKINHKFLSMKKILTVLLSGCILLACNSATDNQEDSVETAQNTNDSVATVTDKTSEFAIEAASGGMMEVQLGQMAQQKAQSKRVKDFGSMMVNEHTKANDELKSLAAQKNITLPTALSEKHQKHVDDLSGKTGNDFDKAYMDLMVEDHEEDVEKFQDAAQNLPDSTLKSFAAKTVPVLEKHLQAAKAIHDNMK
jgi:putative membrane protein